jgi:hypothetical protein
MRFLILLAFVLPLAAQNTVILADSTALGQQFRRWHPFLAVVGDTRWADGSGPIDDPGAGLATKNERRTARLAGWRAVLDGYTNAQIRDLGYNAFESWAKPCKAQFTTKIRAAMGDPDATVAEMRTWVRDNFALWEISDTAPAWAHQRGCSSGSLHMGTPGVGTTSEFGAPVTAVAWSHPFTEIQLHWLEALIHSRSQEDHVLLLDALPADWVAQE